jgi:hypothetical protein
MELLNDTPPSIFERNKEKREVYPGVALFKAYLEGNLRVPQLGVGIIAFMFSEMLASDEFSFEEAIKTKLSDEQVERLLSAMHSAHKSKGVLVGTEEGIEEIITAVLEKKGLEKRPEPKSIVRESTMQSLWLFAVDFLLDIVPPLLVSLEPKTEKLFAATSRQEIAVKLDNVFAEHPEPLSKICAVFETIKSVFLSNRGKALSKRDRLLYKDGPIEYEETLPLKIEIKNLVENTIRRKHPEVTDIFDYENWPHIFS